jgi:hypothetical protein
MVYIILRQGEHLSTFLFALYLNDLDTFLNIVFVLLTIVGTIYILSSAVILQCLKDFYQEDSQKNNLFLEPIILETYIKPENPKKV